MFCTRVLHPVDFTRGPRRWKLKEVNHRRAISQRNLPCKTLGTFQVGPTRTTYFSFHRHFQLQDERPCTQTLAGHVTLLTSYDVTHHDIIVKTHDLFMFGKYSFLANVAINGHASSLRQNGKCWGVTCSETSQGEGCRAIGE